MAGVWAWVFTGPGSVWLPVRYGLIGAVFALTLLSATHAVVDAVGVPLGAMWWRTNGTLPPSQATATRLCFLLQDLDEVRGAWRQAHARRRIVKEVEWTIWYVERAIPSMMWWAGFRGPALTAAVLRCRHAAGVLRGVQWRLINACNREDYDHVCDELATAAVAAAGGDWSLLTGAKEPTTEARAVALLRRLVAPALLTAAALTLPYVPGVAVTGSALTGLQVGLIITAILSLTPVEHSSQDQILGAFRDGNRRG
jgi:hypothetical protein